MKSDFSAYSIFLHVALVALAAVTIVLAGENRALRQRQAPPVSGPEVGQAVDNLGWRPLDGDEAPTQLVADGRDSLLFIFTTDCPACQATQPLWAALHERVGDTVHVVGISLDDVEATRAYRDAQTLPFPVGVPTDPLAFVERFAVYGVPLTVRVGPDGRVKGNWSGTLSDRQRSEIVRVVE